MSACSKNQERLDKVRALICSALDVPADTPLGELLRAIDKHPDSDVSGMKYMASELLSLLYGDTEECDCEDEDRVVGKSNN